MKISELNRGDKIISADSRIWEISGFDYPVARLTSGSSLAYVYVLSKVKQIKNGFIILKE